MRSRQVKGQAAPFGGASLHLGLDCVGRQVGQVDHRHSQPGGRDRIRQHFAIIALGIACAQHGVTVHHRFQRVLQRSYVEPTGKQESARHDVGGRFRVNAGRAPDLSLSARQAMHSARIVAGRNRQAREGDAALFQRRQEGALLVSGQRCKATCDVEEGNCLRSHWEFLQAKGRAAQAAATRAGAEAPSP
jgi:hypothetical protein